MKSSPFISYTSLEIMFVFRHHRQLIIGEALYVCFVDFSKAFDLVNCHILFFKIMKGGWSGRVIDTLRDLYSKTCFRVKRDGKLSPDIPSLTGVNQGGVASGIFI